MTGVDVAVGFAVGGPTVQKRRVPADEGHLTTTKYSAAMWSYGGPV